MLLVIASSIFYVLFSMYKKLVLFKKPEIQRGPDQRHSSIVRWYFPQTRPRIYDFFFRAYQNGNDKRDIIIYTGIHGVMVLKDQEGVNKPIYFNVDRDQMFPVQVYSVIRTRYFVYCQMALSADVFLSWLLFALLKEEGKQIPARQTTPYNKVTKISCSYSAIEMFPL